MANKPQHGDITVETTPGFESWNITATLHLNPTKVKLSESERKEFCEWLLRILKPHVAELVDQPLFVTDMKISELKLKTHCDTCGLPLACGIKVCKCPRKPHPIQCGGF